MCYILYTLQPAAATVAANSYPDIYTAANPNATLDQLTEGTLHEQAAAQASAAAEVGYSSTLRGSLQDFGGKVNWHSELRFVITS